MNNKKKLKGFTLIELIIVLALFGAILSIAMSLIDPVSRVMKKATTRERTAAYADNICEYITNSISYAKFARSYGGDFSHNVVLEDGSFERQQFGGATLLENEALAAEELVANVLNDAVNKDGSSVTGTVRVMKFINDSVDSDGDGTDDLLEGHIYESSYPFKAGYRVTKLEVVEGGTKETVVAEERPTITTDTSAGAVINRDVINPEHLNEYCYHYTKGFHTLDPLSDPDDYSIAGDSTTSFDAVPGEYYSSLSPIRNTGDLNYDDCSLSINVIAYQRDSDGGLSNKIRKVEHELDDGTVEEVTLFRSPAHLKSASMLLINALKVNQNQGNLNKVLYVKPERNEDGSKAANKNFIAVNSTADAYLDYNFDGVSDNIYVVYIMPNEMSDVNVNYN